MINTHIVHVLAKINMQFPAFLLQQIQDMNYICTLREKFQNKFPFAQQFLNKKCISMLSIVILESMKNVTLAINSNYQTEVWIAYKSHKNTEHTLITELLSSEIWVTS